MSFTTLQAGQLFILQALTQKEILRLKLYSNDKIPNKLDGSTAYNEVIHPDYATKLLTPTEWVYDIDDLTNDYTATFAEQVWTFSTPVTAYGYMITDYLGTTVIMAERFPTAPVSLTGPNDKIKVTPIIGVR